MKARYQPGGEARLVQDVLVSETFWYDAGPGLHDLHQRINTQPHYPPPLTQVECVRLRDGQLQRINFGQTVLVDRLPDLDRLQG